MAYIGQGIKNGTFTVLDTSGNTYNGSNVTFSLGTQVGSAAQLLVSHDGVIQKPGTDYSLATGGTQITFSTAPASGASIFIVEISGAVGGPINGDLDGAELVLDTDGDTSITADTDDQIDIKIANADDFTFTANSFNVLSGSEIDLADDCELRVGNGDDLKIFHNGSNSIIASQTGDLQIRAGDTGQNFYVYDHDASNAWFKITGTNGYIQAIGVYNQSAGDSANVVIDGSGNLYRSTSALKYKQNVRDLESIDISGFRPVRYKSKSPKDDPNKDFLGFIADEFHDAGLTELVSYGNDSDGKPTVVEGFNYDRLTVILTKALQEANAKIATLENKVKALEDA